MKRRKAGVSRVSRLPAAKPNIRWSSARIGDGVGAKFSTLTRGDFSASVAQASGSPRERKDKMAKGREKSDDRTVPQGRRKPVVTAAGRGGRAVTASQQARQLGLRFATADSPQGDDDGADEGQPSPAPLAVPKARNTKGNVAPAMTMEEVASQENLVGAFAAVASNKGAPGPDRQSIEEVREHLPELLPRLQRELLADSYEPGMVRRVWIPKPGGSGQRGLGIPDVIDRLVQQAVLQVLSPHYEPTFHASSHGFRPGHSCHTAIAEARKHIEAGYGWVVDFDVEKFFDNVNQDRLLGRLEERIKDRRVIRLIPPHAEGQGGDAGWGGGEQRGGGAARRPAVAIAE